MAGPRRPTEVAGTGVGDDRRRGPLGGEAVISDRAPEPAERCRRPVAGALAMASGAGTGGATGAPRGGALRAPHRKMRTGVSSPLPSALASRTSVSISLVSTVCTW